MSECPHCQLPILTNVDQFSLDEEIQRVIVETKSQRRVFPARYQRIRPDIGVSLSLYLNPQGSGGAYIEEVNWPEVRRNLVAMRTEINRLRQENVELRVILEYRNSPTTSKNPYHYLEHD